MLHTYLNLAVTLSLVTGTRTTLSWSSDAKTPILSKEFTEAYSAGSVRHVTSSDLPAFGRFYLQQAPESWKQSPEGDLFVLSELLRPVLPSPPEDHPLAIPFVHSLPTLISTLRPSDRVSEEYLIRSSVYRQAKNGLKMYNQSGRALPENAMLAEALHRLKFDVSKMSGEKIYSTAIQASFIAICKQSTIRESLSSRSVGTVVGPYHVVEYNHFLYLEPFFVVKDLAGSAVWEVVNTRIDRAYDSDHEYEMSKLIAEPFKYLVGRSYMKSSRRMKAPCLERVLEQLEFLVWHPSSQMSIYDHIDEIEAIVAETKRRISLMGNLNLPVHISQRLRKILSSYYHLSQGASDSDLFKLTAELTGRLLINFASHFPSLQDLGYIPFKPAAPSAVKMENPSSNYIIGLVSSEDASACAYEAYSSFEDCICAAIVDAKQFHLDTDFIDMSSNILLMLDLLSRKVRTFQELKSFLRRLNELSSYLSKKWMQSIARADH